MSPDRSNFLRSLGAELEAQQSRVRDLIGGVHWLSDGLHKEALLTSVLERHLPSSVLLTHGFLLSEHRTTECSKELDLVLLDTTHEGPVFRQSGLSMAYARQALVAVSVKSTCNSGSLDGATENLASARLVAAIDNSPDHLWCGAYFYMVDSTYTAEPAKLYDRIANVLAKHAIQPGPRGAPRGPQAICAGPDLFFAIRYHGRVACISGYSCPGLASGILAANLLGHVSLVRGAEGRSLADLIEAAPITPLEPLSFEQELS